MMRRVRCYLRRGLTTATITDRLLEVYGDRLAVRLEEPIAFPWWTSDRLTYGDLRRLSAGLAGTLAARGVGRADRVAIALPNRFEFALWYLAVMRLGAVAVPLNAVLRPSEIGIVIEVAGACTVVTDTAMLKGLSQHVDSRVRVIVADDVKAPAHEAPAAMLGPTDPSAVLLTSGTTAQPRAAVHTSHGLLSRMHLALLFPATRNSLVAVSLPIAHIMGLVSILLPLVAGVPIHFLAEFDAEHMLRAIARERAMIVVGVPAMFQLMAQAGLERFALDSVRAWISASDSVAPELVATFKKHGALIRLFGRRSEALFVDVYGSVELGGAVLAGFSLPGAAPDARGLAAVPLPRCRTAIVDDAGRPARPGTPGELCVRTPSLFRGYLDGERIQEHRRSGWLRTGDVAVKSRFGTIRVSGRLKDLIKCGGYSIAPAEVEAVLTSQPGVQRAVVFGAPHPIKREAPIAAVVVSAGSGITEEQLLERCRARLADFKVPRRIVFVDGDALPVTALCKVVRAELAARFSEEPQTS
jgi:acyl-coenzyme A synthetase/AMP-(fatty) acid ligase